MAERILGIDSGKFAVKCAEYKMKQENAQTRAFSFRTKIGEGDFRDDALETQTCIAEIDGKTYKIGDGARGREAELTTTKKSEIHRITTLVAAAACCSANTEDTMHIAIGLPTAEWANVSKREDYREFMFPKGKIKIKYKASAASDPVEKVFSIGRNFVYPESIGALFASDSPLMTGENTEDYPYIGVIDIGNLNVNAVVWQGINVQEEESITDELGGYNMIYGLSSLLSTKYSRCNPMITANILTQPPEARALPSDDEAIRNSSHKLIEEYLYDYAKKIKQLCDGKRWSTDYMQLVAIGGTSQILAPYLKMAFGNKLTVLNNPQYCNAMGFLKMAAAKIDDSIIIPDPVFTSKTREVVNFETAVK